MAVVHVADVESGALTRESARPHGAEATLVPQLGQRIGLVHELGQLAAAEELLDRGGNRTRVDEPRGRGFGRVLDAHAFLDHPLHPEQADPELLGQQLANRAHAPVAKVVDMVGLSLLDIEAHDFAHDDRQQVFGPQRARFVVGIGALSRLLSL